MGWVLLSSWHSSCSAILPIVATRPVGQDALVGWDQLFPIFFVAQVLCSIELVHAIGCHLY